MKQIPLAIGSEPEPSFENFLPGANGAALAHLLNPAPAGAPVYLWGPAGSGKTHLLRACAREQRTRGQRVGWFGPGDALPWQPDEAWSLLVLDCCDALDADHQLGAFSLVVQALENRTAVLAAGRLPPVDLPLRDDLRTRLGWGHVFALAAPGEAEVRAVLRREADLRGLFLSDEVMGYLMTRFPRDLGHLMEQLDQLDAFALVSKRAITVPLIRRMLAEADAP